MIDACRADGIIRNFYNLWRATGFLALATALLTIAISVHFNPWFDIWRHAFSDLGSSRANSPWIYNTGLIICGVLVCFFSLYLLKVSTTKAEVFSSAMLTISGIFLALIGIYPAGTRPHNFVSMWFFIQIWLSFLSYSIAMTLSRKSYSIYMILTTALAPILAIAIEALWKWPSAALLEAYGVAVIAIGVGILTLEYKPLIAVGIRGKSDK